MHPDAILQALSSSVSDDAPIHLSLSAACRPKRRFKFEAIWLKLEGFEEALREAWWCSPAIVDPFKRLDVLFRNAAEFLQSWGGEKSGEHEAQDHNGEYLDPPARCGAKIEDSFARRKLAEENA
jgi:hypothetical protein